MQYIDYYDYYYEYSTPVYTSPVVSIASLAISVLLIPFYNIILAIQTQVKLARAFGKSGGFAVGLIFLPYVFQPILGFDGSAYLGVPGRGRRVQQEDYAPNSSAYQQPEPEFRVTFCPNCGAKVNGGKFCENCGKPL